MQILRIKDRLLKVPDSLDNAHQLTPEWMPDVPFNDAPVPAAVLIALVMRESGPTIVYTERSSSLRKHSGQVAFPGGRIDEDDESIASAALREAREEIALDPADAEVIGYMPPMFTGTNFLITPVVAVARPANPFVANPAEVNDVFEVPLARVADVRSYSKFTVKHRGQQHWTWQLDHEKHHIWGITANLTHQFRELALDEVAA